jgi:LDH2 family malate/lactate/ureidoglycolate dehydrogenase
MTAALLGGLCMIGDPEPSFIGAQSPQAHQDERGRIAGVLVAAFDPDFFGGVDGYRAIVVESVEAARRVAAADGVNVLMPGEIERRSRARRTAEGLGVPQATWNDLQDIARRFDLQLPNAVS